MSILLNVPQAHPQLILGTHVTPGWLLQGGTTGGGSLRWLSGLLGDMPFEEMSAQAEEVPPGADGLLFLPYMAGERSPLWEPDARGVLLGLGYDKGKAHMTRAVMEGVAFALQHNLDTAASVARPEALYAVGGAAKSRVWTQIKADVCDLSVHVPGDEATTRGAAMLAGIGIGMFTDAQQAVDAMVCIERTHEPDMQTHRQYRDMYGLYLEAIEANLPLMRRVAKGI